MDIRENIIEFCNPVTSKDLIKLINIFDDLDYDEYMTEIYDRIDESIENDSGNVGRLISNLIMNHAYEVLLEIGITISKDIEDITVKELYSILDFNLSIDYIDKDIAESILSSLEVSDDLILEYSKVMAKYTNINQTRLYEIIEKIDIDYINAIVDISDSISNNETDKIFNYDVVSLIKELRVNDDSEITALRIIRNDYSEDQHFEELVRNNLDKVFNQDIKVTAVNIMSLLILAPDSRFNRLKYYTEYFEDLIEDEYYKMQLFKELKTLDLKIIELYKKFNIEVNEEE